ncbi:hypothetical protein DBR23_25230 [Acidovorax sp. HMWF018]|uniref:SIR2 family protein n=1 Tax=Acidovorax sp. HMWF018 TaxID=2056855 RepID=UPI000D39F0E0|nr:SIR2 family protein [Acidovorax sp. HMWF018]PTT34817.1 hypothetical protein DBR23_25230 [Acidovorax sp. HMWF018]
MDLAVLEERLSSFGSGGHYLFESFIIKLLQAEANSRGQTFIHHSGNNISASDAVAPDGFADIPGPVYIEIVKSLSSTKVLREVIRYDKNIHLKSGSLLFISTNLIGNEIEAAKRLSPTLRVIFWGSKEIQELVNKHQDVSSELANNLFSNRLRVAIEGKEDDWKEQRKSVTSAVRESYISGRFSLLLGAGVSSSAGLPDWDTLLNSLFVSMLTEDGVGGKNADQDQIASIVKRLRHIDGPSAITLARYIRKGITADSQSEQGKFIEAVTQQLYGLRNKKFSLSSPLIKSIANLCAPTRTGAKVRAVLTYNFDDLIEKEIESRGFSYKSIFEEVDIASTEELPIYHVHGFLPENRGKYQNINKTTLVFSEEGYHHIYREAYHWSNLIQLNSLKETTCLMVGLSLTDPNLRRLLEISAKSTDRPKHFAFMKRITYDNFSTEDGKPAVRAPNLVIKKFLDRHHKLNEEVLRELGVNIIWYEKYDEIPLILQEISKTI